VIRRLLPALLVALAMLLALAGSASAGPQGAAVSAPVWAPTVGPDCRGDAPLPSNPNGHIAVRPSIVSDGDPFSSSGVSIQSVYGTNYTWWTYDNGCSPQDGIMPSLGANIGNLLGLELPGLLPSWGQGLFSLVVDPSSWIGSLDPLVAGVTASTAAGAWFPWLSFAMTLVAIVTLIRARRGHLSGSINAIVWALLVLVVTSWAVRYPVESVKLLDDGVQTAVVAVADGFDSADFVGPVAPRSAEDKGAAAKETLDRQWDTLTRETLFRSWADGAFGDADGATARTYGPGVFKATHFSWTEYDAYAQDPAGAGARIVDAKAQAFRQLADTIQRDDPVAYDYFTGNRWGDRISLALLSFMSVLMVALFLVAAGVVVVGAYVLIRLLLPLTPVAGVVFLVDSTRDVALALFKRVVKPLVMGPIFFLAALVVLRYNVGILRSDLPDWLKLVLVFLVAYIVWRMLRPTAVMPRLRLPGGTVLSGYVGSRLGTQRGQEAALEDAQGSGERPTGQERQQPVHYAAALPPSPQPLFLGDARTPQDVGTVTASTYVDRAGHGHEEGAERGVVRGAVLGSVRGTFAPREVAVGAGAPAVVVGPSAREVSAGRPTFARIGAGSGGIGQAGAEQYVGHPADPDVADGQAGQAGQGGPKLPALPSVRSTAGAATVREPSLERSVAGRVLDAGDVGAPPAVDDSNLTYDSEGRRVFVVFTPRGNPAPDRSLTGAS
jgi:hypothetical protein